MEQWALIGIELEGKGTSRPDYLLRPRNGNNLLVEVRTLFPSDRMLSFDNRLDGLKQYFSLELRKRGIYAKDLSISTDIFGIEEMEEHKAVALKAIYSEAKERRKMGMKNIIANVPGGNITLTQEGIHYSGSNIRKKIIVDEMARQAYSLYAAKMQGFNADAAKERDYSSRIEDRIKKKEAQVLKSGSSAGAVIAICLADSDISVSEALRYARAGIERRINSDGKANAHTIIIFSFHCPEIERLKNKISAKLIEPINQMEARLPAAMVQVAWINITDAAPHPNIIKTVPIKSDRRLDIPDLVERGMKHTMFLMEDLIAKEFV